MVHHTTQCRHGLPEVKAVRGLRPFLMTGDERQMKGT